MSETYMQKRYKTDKAFREKQIKYATKYLKEHQERANMLNRIRYANRTPQQIKARKLYLKKLRSKK